MNNSIKKLLLSLLIAASAAITTACAKEAGSSTNTMPASGTDVTVSEAASSSDGAKSDKQIEAPDETGTQGGETTAAETQGENADGLWADAKYTEDTEVGEGNVTVNVKVIAGEKGITITIHTDCEHLGDALVENKLVEGDKSEYGLYINSVNGILADYDKNQSWWAISKDGEMLMTGADSTPITDGENYELTYTKG